MEPLKWQSAVSIRGNFLILVAKLVISRVCMVRVGYGQSLSWAEFVMGRDVQLPKLSPIN